MNKIFWSNTTGDIKTTIKLKLGYESAKISQEYQTIATILSQVLGGKKKAAPTKDFAQAEAQLKGIFGGN